MQYVRGPFPPEFRDAAASLAFAILLSAAAPAMAQQQSIYKWVDEHGVVNYGNAEVPKNTNISLVDTSPQITARPADAKPGASAAKPTRLSDADVLREQLARSHEEIARLRRAAAANGDAAEETPVKAVPTSPKPASLEIAGAPKAANKAGGTISTMQ
jgi:hypothetical protein